ncbi:MAG: GldG family protein [Myxococcota bacterium]
MKTRSMTNSVVWGIAVIGSLVLINIIGVKVFERLDLTRDGQYTLSDATVDTMVGLTDPVTVRAYFTKDLPPPYSTNARYVQDLLEEYYAHGNGYFRYEFIDPKAEETSEDKEKKKEVKHDIFGRPVREKTSVEVELEAAGIPAVQVRVNEDDKLVVKRAYMGLSIKYRDKAEVIPVLQETAGLEYDLTTLIRKLTRNKTPKVAFLTAESSFNPAEKFSQIYSVLGQNYDVTTIDMGTTPKIDEGIDAIVVVASAAPFTEAAQQAIDTFVVSGRSAAFLLDVTQPDLQTLATHDTDHGLGPMLTTYGATLENGLLLDVECATINISQQRGWMRISEPIRYPFGPIAKTLDSQNPLTRGLSEAAFPFMSPVDVTLAKDSAVKADVLVTSSEESWVASPPYNLDPKQRWTKDQVGEQKSRNFMVSLTGPLPSHFAAQEGGDPAVNARVLVAGGASFLSDQFLSPTNKALALNLMDWLLLDEALLSVRARGLGAAKIEDVSEGARAAIKYGNIVGLPSVFVGLGLVRWRRREARRGKATV